MTLDSLEVLFEKDKRAFIELSKDGLLVYTDPPKDLTTDNLFLLSCVTFMYLGTHQKGVILTPSTIVDYGLKLYRTFLKSSYKRIKTFAEMSEEEFNEVMKEYNGRNKK